ncbi:MAG: hypothetical protein ACRD22_07510 [Terriglobia bacterium]
MQRRLFFLTTSLLCAAIAWGQGSYKLQTGGAAVASQIPSSIKSALEPHGDILTNSQGSPVCEIWWRKDIPEQKNPAASGDILYGQLSVGELLGVLRFPKAAKDYRGQAIQPGYYTLRYALIPQDGNHMGVSTYRDFVLLIPIAGDPGPSEDMTFAALVKASRMATSAGHPAVLMADPALQDPSATYPSATQDDQGNWALNVKLDTASGRQPQPLTFALILVGQYQAQ